MKIRVLKLFKIHEIFKILVHNLITFSHNLYLHWRTSRGSLGSLFVQSLVVPGSAAQYDRTQSCHLMLMLKNNGELHQIGYKSVLQNT